MNVHAVLLELLQALSVRQSFCPLCQAEYGHHGECSLKEYWDHGVKEK